MPSHCRSRCIYLRNGAFTFARYAGEKTEMLNPNVNHEIACPQPSYPISGYSFFSSFLMGFCRQYFTSKG